MCVAEGYRVQVQAIDVCGEIATVRMSRPAEFVFAAGQWLRLTLRTVEGDGTKTFTIASAPADDWLEVTMRISGSPFKSAVGSLQQGDQVDIAGPGGRLRLPEQAASIAFLVGGIGITPVRSMLRDALNTGRVFSDALIVYGNRDPSCVPYADELAAMRPAGIRVADVFETAPPSWNGPRGFITAELVRSLVDPGDGRIFVVAGPPVMVAAMQHVLDDMGVEEPRRIVEWFGPPIRVSGDDG